MSAKPAVLESALAPFVLAGMRVSVVGTLLLLHDVPVVNSERQIEMGVLVATFIYSDSAVTPPATHQAWFDGPFPCFPDGRRMEQMFHSNIDSGQLAQDVPARHFFSNKPLDWSGYASHYALLMHYWNQIAAAAMAVDPFLRERMRQRIGEIRIASHASPFVYSDACSARGNFSRATERLAMDRVAIIGVGGTGAYVLDQVAKTPVREIHIFDYKPFEQHNAFRAPGAASEADFGQSKVDYYARVYGAMHRGIQPHSMKVDATNAETLSGMGFVFVCIDHGPSRRLICQYLIDRGIPFVDVGMDLSLSSAQQIWGTVRTTACVPGHSGHFWDRAPDMELSGDGLYEQNIQVADLNALNAQMAVIKWKQLCGFYALQTDAMHQEYMTQTGDLVLGDKRGVPIEA